MGLFIAICGFFGGWALVAGPVYQASIELEELDFDRRDVRFDAAAASVPGPEPVSAWWWLLPPVAYGLRRSRSDAYHQRVMNSLPADQRKQLFAFFDKARGWLLVALGALLIAVKETWELIEHLEWPTAVFWVLIVVMAALSVGFAALRQQFKNTFQVPED